MQSHQRTLWVESRHGAATKERAQQITLSIDQATIGITTRRFGEQGFIVDVATAGIEIVATNLAGRRIGMKQLTVVL